LLQIIFVIVVVILNVTVNVIVYCGDIRTTFCRLKTNIEKSFEVTDQLVHSWNHFCYVVNIAFVIFLFILTLSAVSGQTRQMTAAISCIFMYC